MDGGTALSRFEGFSAAWALQVVAPLLKHQPQLLHQLAKHQLLQRVQRQPLLKHQLQLQTTLAKQVAVHILSKQVTPCTQSLVVMGWMFTN